MKDQMNKLHQKKPDNVKILVQQFINRENGENP